MKKRFLALSLVSLLAIGGLTGCGGQKVTAESLIDGAYGTEKIASVDMDISFNIDADINAGDLFNSTENIDDTEIDSDMQVKSDDTKSTDTFMNFKVALDANAKANEKVVFIDGNIDVNLFGFSQKVPTKSYSDLENNIVYTYNEDTDSWTKADKEDSKIDVNEVNKKLSNDIFNDLKLEESKDNDIYTVTGTITMDKLQELYGDALNDVLDSESEDFDTSKIKFDVKMTFDKKSKIIKSMDYVIDSSSLDSDQYKINDFSFKVVFNKINDVDISIPDDVINNATDEIDFTTSFE